MKEFLLARMKAVIAVIGVPLAALVIAAIEAALGFGLSNELKLTITAAISGVLVHQVPNKTT